MLDSTKINFSQKKLSGKQHTWNSKKWYEEQDGIVLFQHAKEIWIDKIPEEVPLKETTLIKPHSNIILKEDKTVQGRKCWYAVDSKGQKIKGFVPSSYGINYSAKIFVNGTKLPTTHESGWIFDYANGILTFENSPPAGTITLIAYEYVGRSMQQYLDAELNSIAIGVLGESSPEYEYVLQHNFSSFDIQATIYVFDSIDGSANGKKYWKLDVVPMIMLDENRIKIQLTEKHPIRFVLKAYSSPNFG